MADCGGSKSSKTRQDSFLGIDLGTTFSSLAFVDSKGRTETIRSDDGELTTPSIVFFDSPRPIVGREALKAGRLAPHRVACFVKRHLGEKSYPRELRGHHLPPEVIQGVLLERLKATAEKRIGLTDRVVVTVPAYFNEIHRVATRNACRLAGFGKINLLNEPTAAAIAYGVESGFLDAKFESKKNELVMVFDLGGGTFDVTIVEIGDRRIDEIATAGDGRLGGLDWDRRLFDHVIDQLVQCHGIDVSTNGVALNRIRQTVEETKKSLTYRHVTTLGLEISGINYELEISREILEELTADLLERTRLISRRLILESGLEWSDLTQLVLVGGSTRMPAIQQMLREESGLELNLTLSPDEAVAHGAALFGATLDRCKLNRKVPLEQAGNESQFGNGLGAFEVATVCTHSLGVLGMDRRSGTIKHQVMIPRQSLLPAEQSRKFFTARQDQKSVVVTIIEEKNEPQRPTIRIGKCVVADLPPGLPRGTCVEVDFRYTQEGILTVDARLPDIGRRARITIERFRELSAGQMGFWQSAIRNGLDLDNLAPGLSGLMVDNKIEAAADRNGQVIQNDPNWIVAFSEEAELELELDKLLAELETHVRTDEKGRSDQPGLRDREQKGIHVKT